MPQKTQLPATLASCRTGEPFSNGSSFIATLTQPLMRPQAMKAGMSGMKMLAMRRNSNFSGVAFLARMAAWSCSA